MADITKQTIDRIVELGETRELDINGRKYTTKQIYSVKEPEVESLQVHTLTGVVDAIESMNMAPDKTILLIESYDRVKVMSTLFGPYKQRECLVDSKCFETRYQTDRALDIKDFIVHLQSHFVADYNQRALVKVIGNVTQVSEIENADDGFTQHVKVKKGIHLAAMSEIPNPIELRPYRTFMDIEQPPSMFTIRLEGSGVDIRCRITESDGGLWKNLAILNIKNFLTDNLAVPVSVIA